MIGARLTSPATVLEAGGDLKPPDDLWVTSIPNGLQLIFGCGAWKWNSSIDFGEFRAKWIEPGTGYPESVDLRTVAEGGTLVHDGSTAFVVTGLTADWSGCQYDFTSPEAGRWYFAFRLHNSRGWSVWSDGNDTPDKVKDYCDTEAADVATDGPPEDWTTSVIAAVQGHAVIVTASRPAIHGSRIWGIVVQVKDKTTGSWIAIDSATSPGTVLFDGSAIPHTLSDNGTRLTRNSGTGFGSAAVGDLILFDVRGGAFDQAYCLWGTVKALGSNYVDVQGRWRGTDVSADDYRIKIVTPPWLWASGGYLGATPNAGLWGTWYIGPDMQGDTISPNFVSDPIDIPAGIDLADIEARVWFDNGYSRNDDGNYGGGGLSAGQCILLADAATISTDASLDDGAPSKQFRVSVAADRILGNPTNARCGQVLRWCIVNATGSDVTVTLDDKFRVGQAFPEFPGPFNIATTSDYDPDWLEVGRAGGMFLGTSDPPSGYLAGMAGPGALFVDRVEPMIYVNTGTKVTPVWAPICS